MARFLAGIVATLVVLALGVLGAVLLGLVPVNADGPPFPGEEWAAHRALNAAVKRDAPPPPYPYGPASDATLAAGAKLYMANCADCHGSGAAKESNMSRGFYISAPQFNKDDVTDDPTGETYWKIAHGIRFTAIPAFKPSLTDEQMWQIAYFLKNGTDKLPAAAAAEWNKPHGD